MGAFLYELSLKGWIIFRKFINQQHFEKLRWRISLSSWKSLRQQNKFMLMKIRLISSLIFEFVNLPDNNNRDYENFYLRTGRFLDKLIQKKAFCSQIGAVLLLSKTKSGQWSSLKMFTSSLKMFCQFRPRPVAQLASFKVRIMWTKFQHATFPTTCISIIPARYVSYQKSNLTSNMPMSTIHENTFKFKIGWKQNINEQLKLWVW